MAERRIEKTVKNAVLYSDGTILLKNVRASYPHVLIPSKEGVGDDGKPMKPRYGIVAMLPKSTHVEAKNLVRDFIRKMLADAKIGDLPTSKKFLRDGDEEGKDEKKRVLLGHWIVSANSDIAKPPRVRDADGRTTLAEKDAARIYGGCWVNILIRPWAQNHAKYGRRANASLNAVQFVRNDEAFGAGVLSDDELDDIFDPEEGAEGNAWDDEADDL